jgi:tetrahydromethanopterin S-methyltransferase subunit G
MSSLLEQAIIDAKTLKETARRNAEAAILEKYSSEIKNSIEMLLEQDEAAGTDTPVLPDSPAELEPTETVSEEAKAVMDKIPPAYLGENNLEEIELDLDSLVEKIDSMKKELNVQSAEMPETFVEPVPQPTSRIAADTLAEGEGMPETAEETLEEEVLELEEAELQEMNLEPKFSETELLTQLNAARAAKAPPAKIDALQKRLDAVRAEKKAAIAEEITLDMEVVTPGGLQGNQIETDKQIAVAKALEAQMSDLKEHLTIKDAEIAELYSMLEESKEQLKNTKDKLSKSMKVNLHLKESFEQFSQKLNEVNLLNARLLYSNKALRNASLNERQRDQIAEAISRAASVEEARTVYETLQKSMQAVVEKRSAPQSLSEALSKAPSPFLPRNTQASADPVKARWQLIAGIKK